MGRRIITQFESPADFYAYVDNCRRTPTLILDKTSHKRQRRDVDEDYSEWYGASDEHQETHRYGDEALVKRAEELNTFTGKGTLHSKQVTVFSDDGDDLDMERYLEGEEFCFLKRRLRVGKQRRKVMSLYVNIGENCGTRPESMLYKALAAIKLIDSIESAGDRAEIFACCHAVNAGIDKKGNSVDLVVIIKLKTADEPVNLSLIAHHLAPAFFRNNTLEIFNFLLPMVNSSYGCSRDMPKDLIGEDSFYIGNGQCLGAQEANDWLEHTGDDEKEPE